MFRLCWAALNGLWALVHALAGLPRQAAAALGAPSDGRTAHPRRLPIALAAILPLCLAASLVLPKVTLVMSPSIDAWVVRAAPGPVRKGDLVEFMLAHPAVGPKPVSATKYALCMPGERLEVIERPSRLPGSSDGHFYCNGVRIGVSLPRGPKGMALQHLTSSGVVPPGYAYVGSSHARGFDSRYIGLVPMSRLRRMEKLL
jgi:conjugal transfer pilin signal peptidase TrbI